jgi:hypothetical protein
MTSKVYKGAGVHVDGSNSGAHPFITKMAYGCANELVYVGETRFDHSDEEPKHYIEKLFYNCTYSLESIKIAQNKLNANATEISITQDASHIYVTLTPGNGDFLDVTTGDSMYVKTPTQVINNYPVIKVSDTQVKILRDTNLSGIVDELNASITVWDILTTIKNKDLIDFEKRRWTQRERYVYA